jgi:cell fate regulator YaaT (PSP1 superfamily)
MACLGCSCSTGKDSVGGCGSNGGCSTGGCNRHNTYDWITALGIADTHPFDIVEVSFKNGSRKDFFKNPPFTRTTTGDFVLVESPAGGYDLGKISLSGELVRLQMKRKRVKNDAKLGAVIRKANERDLERLDELRKEEKNVMIKARTIARTLDLQMKVCDIEFQGDGRKCTFFYTAEGRVDFRELIRHYAKEFKVKIEMRQIGARQESSRIGGLGNCGRELCCSTWLTEFKSVNTAAARYQNLAINQTKLSGMCGRLKCCLNYELDTYVDALEDFPDKADKLKTKAGLAVLMKTDVFKRLMFFAYADNKIKFYPLHVDQVWDAMDMIKNGQIPESLDDILAMAPPSEEIEEDEPDFENVDNVIQLPLEKRKKKKKKKKKARGETAAAAVERAEQADLARVSGRSGQQRGPRPDGQSRGGNNHPNNRQGGGDNRPPRTEGGNNNRQGGGQSQKGGNNNPNNKQGGGDNRPPRPEGGGQQPKGGNNNPSNKQGGGDNRPPRPEGGGGQQPKGGNNNPNNKQGGGDNRPPRPEGGGQQPKGGNNNPNNKQGGGGDNRPPRPEGGGGQQPKGGNNNPNNKQGGGDNRPPRPEGGGGQQPKGGGNNPNNKQGGKPKGGERPPGGKPPAAE